MIPSVTQILQPWSGLQNIPSEVLAKAAARGVDVHFICLNYAQGLWVPPDLAAPHQGYFDSFRRWFDVTVIECFGVETELTSPIYNFMGHPDLPCRLKGDSAGTVVDIKTPLILSKTWPIQTAAYRYLLRANDHDIRRHGTLRLSKEGKRAKFNGFSKEYDVHWLVFLSCLNAYNYFRRT